MKLSTYINDLKEILDVLGDTELLFTASDDEGNSYNRAGYSPDIRLIHSKNPSDEWRVDQLIEERKEGESLESWLDDNCLDEEDLKDLHKVVLL